MALARTLMNGGTYDVNIATGTYGQSNGALKIAMESAEELHEIFTESFYNMNQIELEAMTEGVSLDDSRVTQLLEATGVGVLEKIKNFFKKLWAKVKEFFHNIKRYIDSLFMSGKEFVSKYKADIDAVKGMKKFEYKMFKYADSAIDDFERVNDGDPDGLIELFSGFVDKFDNMTDDEKKEQKETPLTDKNKKTVESIKKDMEEIKKDVYTIDGTHCDDTSEVAEAMYSLLRDGATDSNDKPMREFSEVSSLAKILTSSKASSNISKAQSKTDSYYKKLIATMDKAQTKAQNIGGAYMSTFSDTVRELSSVVSDCQSVENTIINSVKEAYKERDAAYKACIMAALSYYRKNGKN